jgi:hypothetical protein
LTRAYRNTSPGCKLRLYISKFIVYVATTFDESMTSAAWTNDLLGRMVRDCEDLGTDIFALLRKSSGLKAPDPREAPACDYHQHGKEEACPYKKK